MSPVPVRWYSMDGETKSAELYGKGKDKGILDVFIWLSKNDVAPLRPRKEFIN